MEVLFLAPQAILGGGKAGETDPKRGLADLIADSKVGGLIAGGVMGEVDGAIGYFQDVIGSGRKIAMLAVGYGPSEDRTRGQPRWRDAKRSPPTARSRFHCENRFEDAER